MNCVKIIVFTLILKLLSGGSFISRIYIYIYIYIYACIMYICSLSLKILLLNL